MPHESISMGNRFDQGTGQAEVHENDSTPYNKGQWRSLHIGNAYDKHPGSATKAVRNNNTLNDPAQSGGAYPRKNHYTHGLVSINETGIRQYRTHEFSTQKTLRGVKRQTNPETTFHALDPEKSVSSYGHSLLSSGGYKGNLSAQIAPPGTNDIAQPRPQFAHSALDIHDLRAMYTLDQSIPNFLTLDRTAKQNFKADITDIRKQVA